MKQILVIVIAVLSLAACGKKPTALLPRAVPAGQEGLYPRAYPPSQPVPPPTTNL